MNQRVIAACTLACVLAGPTESTVFIDKRRAAERCVPNALIVP